MVIIENGYERFFKEECDNCKTLLRYKISDVNEMESTGKISNATFIYKYINCPVCNNKIRLSTDFK